LRFHTFQSIVIALGGENQVPSDPPGSSEGVFRLAVTLYREGYDAHMFDEDRVEADGSGRVFDEVETAVLARQVSEVALVGYSHGGGSVRDLSKRMATSLPSAYVIPLSAYIDAVEQDPLLGDWNALPEWHRPQGSLFHMNYYQVAEPGEWPPLQGDQVENSWPPPTGLNVETTSWGAGTTHFTVDDLSEVLSEIRVQLEGRTRR